MLSAALLLFANTLLFSLRLSGGGSFPKPLTASEEREYLHRCASGADKKRLPRQNHHRYRNKARHGHGDI